MTNSYSPEPSEYLHTRQARNEDVERTVSQTRRELEEAHERALTVHGRIMSMMHAGVRPSSEANRILDHSWYDKERIELRQTWFPDWDTDMFSSDFDFLTHRLGAKQDPLQFLTDCTLGIQEPTCDWSQVYGYLDARKSQGVILEPAAFFTMLDDCRILFLGKYDVV